MKPLPDYIGDYFFPARNIKATLIGGVFNAVPSLLGALLIFIGNLYLGLALMIPFFILIFGYLSVLSEEVLKDQESMPGWYDIIKILKAGLKMTVIVFIFLGLPFLATLSFRSQNIVFLASLVLVVFCFFIPFLMIRLAETKNILQGFRIDIAVKKILMVWKEYMLNFILLMPLLFVTVYLSGLLENTLFFPGLLSFYFYVVLIRMMTVTYAKTI